MTYSRDFREKALFIKEKESLSLAKIAKRFDVGIASVVRWSKDIESKKTRNKPATKIDMEALKKDVEAYPDAYQYERAKRLNVSRAGVAHALKRLGVSYKKNPQSSPSEFRKTICILPNPSRF
ncbi:MAG TPA: IS630 transposase-related protein [Candidatus Babeliales bacterium]|nr:IS630 transposase-related protein [Candidatus Babeliales bacterium]